MLPSQFKKTQAQKVEKPQSPIQGEENRYFSKMVGCRSLEHHMA